MALVYRQKATQSVAMAHLLAIPEQKPPVEIYCPSDVPYWEMKLIRLSSSFLLHKRMEGQNEAEEQRNPFAPTELARFNQPFSKLGREIQPVQDTVKRYRWIEPHSYRKFVYLRIQTPLFGYLSYQKTSTSA